MKSNSDIAITADQARKMADTTPVLLHRIYKVIKDAAHEGQTKLCWSVADTSKTLLLSVINTLKLAGFEVTYAEGSLDLIIAW